MPITLYRARSGGTVQDMAPEQLEGGAIENRTDIFAFGAVLHEMVTGRRAFEGASDAAVIASILQTEPPPLSECAECVPVELERLVKACLSKAASARPASMTDVVSILTAFPGRTVIPGRRWLHLVLSKVVTRGAIVIGALALTTGLTLWPLHLDRLQRTTDAAAAHVVLHTPSYRRG